MGHVIVARISWDRGGSESGRSTLAVHGEGLWTYQEGEVHIFECLAVAQRRRDALVGVGDVLQGALQGPQPSPFSRVEGKRSTLPSGRKQTGFRATTLQSHLTGQGPLWENGRKIENSSE